MRSQKVGQRNFEQLFRVGDGFFDAQKAFVSTEDAGQEQLVRALWLIESHQLLQTFFAEVNLLPPLR